MRCPRIAIQGNSAAFQRTAKPLQSHAIRRHAWASHGRVTPRLGSSVPNHCQARLTMPMQRSPLLCRGFSAHIKSRCPATSRRSFTEQCISDAEQCISDAEQSFSIPVLFHAPPCQRNANCALPPRGCTIRCVSMPQHFLLCLSWLRSSFATQRNTDRRISFANRAKLCRCSSFLSHANAIPVSAVLCLCLSKRSMLCHRRSMQSKALSKLCMAIPMQSCPAPSRRFGSPCYAFAMPVHAKP